MSLPKPNNQTTVVITGASVSNWLVAWPAAASH
ncbi:hypothetical protein K60_016430 [Mycobacterium tuberculosis variant bovis BCG str. Korea 1168P]|uniref:BCG_1596 protein n=1 Tax=Mycobacterium bovis (strain BCG / Pasteur 1173P2) TaxID=410289 RepID=A0A0H3MD66_MYCBP|nr:Hypothetical protein BCGMEX_1568 [Mycobacterium tuberculosis variant bovis BCG str. Mexico]AGE67553.1 hypothetical protein K60_016430 [Mycobacterium tuberculosis variant bovis BCG str. Korea 1168P]CAL71583.1 BCG_1596 [Mycobacterium tuberculosis variant bovis BCG str. Pasteur 1173P2]